jgi:hypothetical protein
MIFHRRLRGSCLLDVAVFVGVDRVLCDVDGAIRSKQLAEAQI